MPSSPKAPWAEKHSKFCDPPLPSIPPSSNSTLHLLGALGHPHSTEEEQALLPLVVGWNAFWPCLADPDNLRHATLTRVPRLLPSEMSRSQPATMQGRCPKLCRWHREFGTGINSGPHLADTCVWGLCLSAMWLNWATTAFTLFSYCSPGQHFTQPMKYLSDASFWPVECACLLSDKTNRPEIEVNRKKITE